MPVAGRLAEPAGVGDEPVDPGRRRVVPPAAGRSLWLSAVWTGGGTALACLIVAVVAVAVLWLPVSGGSGGAGSVLRAGALTFLAAVHGGLTVDGVPTAFLPLGMMLLVGAVAWRAGCGLADVADDLDETDPRRLIRAAALQALAFAFVSAFAAALSPLGTSSAPVLGSAVAAYLLFAVSGGVAFVRWSPLGDVRLPDGLVRAARGAAAAAAVYLAAGALLVAGSLVSNFDRVELLSKQVGGGWSGLPVLLLGLLAAPNAAIAGASYLSGPGFAVGTGSHVSALTTAHGVLPAFPILGAVPTGHGAPWPAWTLMSVTLLVAGGVVARSVHGAPTITGRLRECALTAGLVLPTGLVLAWQGGGAVGSGRLNAVGASPWQFGLALSVLVGVGGLAMVGVATAITHLRGRAETAEASGLLGTSLAVVAAGVASYREEREESAAEESALEESVPESVAEAVSGQERDADDDKLAG